MALCAASPSYAQDPRTPLVFTVGVPDRTASSTTALQIAPVVEERGLAMWSDGEADFGVAATQSGSRWTLRSIASMTNVPIEGGFRPSLRQVELVRNVYSTPSLSIDGGGGIREEWDGTRTLIGRVLAGSDLGSGRLQGSLVMERSVSSPRTRHDAADVVTTFGWSRPIGDRLHLGIESIGQDLEGLWNPAEADGGARLLVGPSVQTQSKHRTWTTSLTAGPVIHRLARSASAATAAPPALAGGNHFAIFASASWMPSMHRQTGLPIQ